MYTIKCDGYILHDPREDLYVISGKGKMEINKTGSLSFYINPNHPNINKIQKLKSEIILYEDDEAIFYGRPLNVEINFNNLQQVTCEGELAELLDTIQRPCEYHIDGGSDNAVETYFKSLINNHNSQVTNDKKFTVGDCKVTDPNNYVYKETNYDRTLDVINDDLIGTYGGTLLIKHKDNKRYISYTPFTGSESPAGGTINQTVDFGENLINYTKTVNGEDVYTALIPLGAKDEENSTELDKRITIKSLPDSTDGTIIKKDDYIYDTEAVKKYGWIFKAEKWDDVTLPSNLLRKGKELLSSECDVSNYIEISAFDLHKLNPDLKRLRICDSILCTSEYHGLKQNLLVESVDIDIDNPSNSKVKLVSSNEYFKNEPGNKKSITDKNKDTTKKINKLETTLKEDATTDPELKTAINKLKGWTDTNYTPREDTAQEINNLKDWVNSNYTPKTDLSEYAKITDVNTAFNELATALEGV